MFRFFLYKFFKVLSKPYKTLDKEMFEKYISEEKHVRQPNVGGMFSDIQKRRLYTFRLLPKMK